MGTFLWILYLILIIYWMLLIARLVIEFIQSLARHWRPRGLAVVLIESVFTVTDPPLKALRRIIKPIDVGSVRLDLSLFLVLIVVTIGWRVAWAFANEISPVNAAAAALT
ncbi:MAG: YggT family protein [Gordonia sp. (in: high G+C Gram-positive bacteria)]|uniref:YggT family protein n=1 Tax=Gordonia sp. (in: high G+C Gram-positive bacteria) TaxID=84139 RepID=UPI0039E24DB5